MSFSTTIALCIIGGHRSGVHDCIPRNLAASIDQYRQDI